MASSRVSRWAWTIPVLAVLILVGIGVAGHDRLARWLVGRFPAEVTYQRLGGDLVRGLTVDGLQAVFPPGDTLTVARAVLRYSPFSFLRGAPDFFAVRLVRPRLALAGNRPASVGRTTYPRLRVGSFRIEDGTLLVGGQERATHVASAGYLNSSPAQLEVSLSRLSGILAGPLPAVTAGRGRVTFCSDSLVFERLQLETARSRLTLTGRITTRGRQHLVLNLTGTADLSELLPGRARGTLAVAADLAGAARDLRGQLTATGRDLGYARVALGELAGDARFEENAVRLHFMVRSPGGGLATADAVLRDQGQTLSGTIGFGEIRLDSLLGGLVPGSSMLSGIAEVEAAQLGAPEPDIRVSLRKVRGRFGSIPVAMLAADLRARGRAYECERLDAELAGGTVHGSGRWQNGDYQAALELAAVRLGTIAAGTGFAASGPVSGQVRLGGRGDSTSVRADLAGTDLAGPGVAAARYRLQCRVDDLVRLAGSVNLDLDRCALARRPLGDVAVVLRDSALAVRTSGGPGTDEIRLDGRLAFLKGDLELRVERLTSVVAAETLASLQPFRFGKVGAALYVSEGRFAFAGGTVEASAFWNRIDRPQLFIQARAIDLARVGERFGLLKGGAGRLNITLATRAGYDLDLGLIGFALKELTVPDLTLHVGASEDRAEIALAVQRDTARSTIAGSVRYRLDPRTLRLTVNAWDLVADLHDPGPWVLSFLHGIVNVTRGTLVGQVALGGRPEAPAVTGRVWLDGGQLFIPSVNASVEDASVVFEFDHDRIAMRGQGRTGVDGAIAMDGSVRIDRHGFRAADFLFQTVRGPVHRTPDVYALVTGSLKLTWQTGQPLTIHGDFAIDQALLTYPFGEPSATPRYDTTRVDYELHYRAANGVWLRNSAADIEFSCDVTERSYDRVATITGELEPVRGSLHYLDHNLQVREGMITFRGTPEFDPALDLTAQIIAYLAPRADAAPEPVRILLHLTGTLREPVFTFTADPPVVTEDDILAYLGAGKTMTELETARSQELFYDVLSQKLIGYFERQISSELRSATGLDYFHFQPGITGSEPSRVTVGKYIGTRLYVSLTHDLFDFTQDAIRASYSLGRRTELVGERTERGDYQLQYRFRVRY